ncbi:MAG: hypothetical protein GWN00_02420, partial [Aliifodinibius sp.]|nr:hypothetical protein [Fodinibius sp.]NIV09776.1 hypothetical protein [Fodinibius sp.]NIY23713.1 hypothetical protein [Fodinibius sp.]
MSVDLKTVLLLLSAALGLSLVIERILEAVKGLIKKMLLREDSPLAEKVKPVETVVSELGAQKIHNKLDDLMEEIEEIRIEMKDAAGDKKEQLKKKEYELEEKASHLVNKYSEWFKAQSGLTRKQRKELTRRQKSLEARFKGCKLDTSRAEFDEKFSQATVIVDPIAPRDPE